MMPKKDYSQYTDYGNYTMLTARELEVIKLKNSGMTTEEIAKKLGVKYNTVSIYLTKSIQKINGSYDYEKERKYKNDGAKKRRENPEYRECYNKYAREYYKKNSEKAKERSKKYQEKNAEKVREYRREYQREYQREYRAKHPIRKRSELTEYELEKKRQYDREYYRKRHPKKERKKKSRIKTELYASSNRRAEKIIDEMSSGKTVMEIAKEQGCTTQNIYGILKSYRKRTENSSGE